jgi:anti-anti-sigma factor
VTPLRWGRTLVALAGEFDQCTAPRVTAALSELGDAEGQHVLIDARDVTFASSALVTALLEARERLSLRRGTVTITTSSPAFRHIVELTGMSERFAEDRPGHAST